MPKAFTVRAVACDHLASDEEVYSRLESATEPLTRSWERLEKAEKIAVKVNQDFSRSSEFEGQRQELVSDSVVRAVLRLLRERTKAKLFCAEASYFKIYRGTDPSETTQIAHILDEFDVDYVDCTAPPYVDLPVPGEESMFNTYRFTEELVSADEVVSVAKMKNHHFMGVTGTLKNLFGLLPAEPLVRPRPYYHHLVRLPYVLCDIGRIFDPALNIVDALVGQAGSEWIGDPKFGRVVDALIAGDNPVATDSCMAWTMGHDPQADFLVDPFLRERNTLGISTEHGYGTNIISDIDFVSEVEPQPAGTFYCQDVDSTQLVIDWRRTMCEQALNYRDSMADFMKFGGNYVLVQAGKVVWHNNTGKIDASRRVIAGAMKNQSLYLKFVDPEEREQERFEVYEQALDRLSEYEVGRNR